MSKTQLSVDDAFSQICRWCNFAYARCRDWSVCAQPFSARVVQGSKQKEFDMSATQLQAAVSFWQAHASPPHLLLRHTSCALDPPPPLGPPSATPLRPISRPVRTRCSRTPMHVNRQSCAISRALAPSRHRRGRRPRHRHRYRRCLRRHRR
eukprot:362276-Pleurochrysis_carterae.AAC.2